MSFYLVFSIGSEHFANGENLLHSWKIEFQVKVQTTGRASVICLQNEWLDLVP